MSLLTSLIRASTQFQQAMERRQTPSTGPEAAPGKAQAKAMETEPTPGDDRFTPSENNQSDLSRLKARRLAMTDYKQTVGQDLAFVRETLRHKLAEYNLHPATALNVSKTENGSVAVEGKIADNTRIQIEKDLNVNKNFKEAFNRLSVNEPTLHFMDNALKLS